MVSKDTRLTWVYETSQHRRILFVTSTTNQPPPLDKYFCIQFDYFAATLHDTLARPWRWIAVMLPLRLSLPPLLRPMPMS